MGATRQVVRILDRWGQAAAIVRNRLHAETENDVYPFLDVLAGVGGVIAGQVVYLTPAETVLPADSGDVGQAGLVVGLAADDAAGGEIVRVLAGGIVYRAAWVLVPGTIYWLGNAGELTDVPPVVGFLQRIGVARAVTVLAIQMGEPVLRV